MNGKILIMQNWGICLTALLSAVAVVSTTAIQAMMRDWDKVTIPTGRIISGMLALATFRRLTGKASRGVTATGSTGEPHADKSSFSRMPRWKSRHFF